MKSSRLAFSRRRGRPAEAPSAGATLALQKDNIAQLAEISRNSQTTFLALILASVYSYLTIATTTDAALLSNSNATPLPIIQVNVPIVWFYYVAPVILTSRNGGASSSCTPWSARCQDSATLGRR